MAIARRDWKRSVASFICSTALIPCASANGQAADQLRRQYEMTVHHLEQRIAALEQVQKDVPSGMIAENSVARELHPYRALVHLINQSTAAGGHALAGSRKSSRRVPSSSNRADSHEFD